MRGQIRVLSADGNTYAFPTKSLNLAHPAAPRPEWYTQWTTVPGAGGVHDFHAVFGAEEHMPGSSAGAGSFVLCGKAGDGPGIPFQEAWAMKVDAHGS